MGLSRVKATENTSQKAFCKQLQLLTLRFDGKVSALTEWGASCIDYVAFLTLQAWQGFSAVRISVRRLSAFAE